MVSDDIINNNMIVHYKAGLIADGHVFVSFAGERFIYGSFDALVIEFIVIDPISIGFNILDFTPTVTFVFGYVKLFVVVDKDVHVCSAGSASCDQKEVIFFHGEV
jgi:hypothetical protein